MVLSFAMPRDRHTATRIWNVCDGMRRRRFRQGGSAETAVSSGAWGCGGSDLEKFFGRSARIRAVRVVRSHQRRTRSESLDILIVRLRYTGWDSLALL
jgi:hypothetical protein